MKTQKYNFSLKIQQKKQQAEIPPTRCSERHQKIPLIGRHS